MFHRIRAVWQSAGRRIDRLMAPAVVISLRVRHDPAPCGTCRALTLAARLMLGAAAEAAELVLVRSVAPDAPRWVVAAAMLTTALAVVKTIGVTFTERDGT